MALEAQNNRHIKRAQASPPSILHGPLQRTNDRGCVKQCDQWRQHYQPKSILDYAGRVTNLIPFDCHHSARCQEQDPKQQGYEQPLASQDDRRQQSYQQQSVTLEQWRLPLQPQTRTHVMPSIVDESFERLPGVCLHLPMNQSLRSAHDLEVCALDLSHKQQILGGAQVLGKTTNVVPNASFHQ